MGSRPAEIVKEPAVQPSRAQIALHLRRLKDIFASSLPSGFKEQQCFYLLTRDAVNGDTLVRLCSPLRF